MCEHCKNWLETKDKEICSKCYWAWPEDYEHVAMEQRRRVELVWVGTEIVQYERLVEQARNAGQSVPELIKACLRKRKRR